MVFLAHDLFLIILRCQEIDVMDILGMSCNSNQWNQAYIVSYAVS